MEVLQESNNFYNKHADEFSSSRFRIWKHVREFLDNLSPNTKVLEIGCGNGKNMRYRNDLDFYGIDSSEVLVDICKKKGLNVIHGDARKLPYDNNSFDSIIMIAVIHHINPDEHNLILNEIERILKPDGKCLITNWAVEQPSDAKRDFIAGLNYVKWKGKESEPLPYWIMDENMTKEFKLKLPSKLDCYKITWDVGNWEFWLNKI